MTAMAAGGSPRKLRVTHCLGFYFPQTVGGTEVYVRDLVTALPSHAIDNCIVAATDGAAEDYEWAGAPVFRYPSNWADLRDHASTSGRAGLDKFQELIVRTAPDVFHLHSWTAGAGLRHLSQVAQLGVRCVATMHVPSAICLRGTMLLNGEQPCDGLILGRRCAQCWAISRGLPPQIASVVTQLPPMNAARDWLSKVSRRGATLLSARALVDTQLRDLEEMAALCERIIAPSQWVHAALLSNGVAQSKLVVSRQAVAESLVALGRAPREPRDGRELRIGFVGRLEPYKGVHILLEALAQITRDVPIKLLVAGSGTERPYLQAIGQKAEQDPRVELVGPISHDQVPAFLRRIDVLAVPSNYMETGPLVVLEAFAFGLPVMGGDLGGIAERVRDGVDGWLLPFRDSSAWAAAMRDAALDRTQVARRAAGVHVERTMADAAGEMAGLYRDVVGAELSPGPAVRYSGG